MKNQEIREIQVDVPTEKSEWNAEGEFFIAVLFSERRNLSFNCIFGNKGICRQVSMGTASIQEEPTDVWKSLAIKDGKLVDERQAKWIDKKEGGKTIIDGKVWESIPELAISLPGDVEEKLLKFTSQIYEHKGELEELDGLFEELDAYIRQVINERLKELEPVMSLQEIRSLFIAGQSCTSVIPTWVENTDLSMEEVSSAAFDEFLLDMGYIEEDQVKDLNLEKYFSERLEGEAEN